MEYSAISLPLHYGKAPYWLLNRMKKLSKQIIEIIINEFGEKEFFERISNPIFFQSFSNVLGFDWNSSGATTVMTGVLKSVLNSSEEIAIRVAGGKGLNARQTPEHIMKLGSFLDESEIDLLIANSRLSARIDNNALQDGYDLYHHAIIFSENYWTVIQQGMNEKLRTARRYHFKPRKFERIEVESQKEIISDRKENEIINLTSKHSRENRKTILDIIRDSRSLKRDIEFISIKQIRGQKTIDGRIIEYAVPRKVNWKAIEVAYSLQPDNFEDLLLIEGMGKGTIRALALIADLIYNSEYDRQDPAKYSFAVGGKDGVPFPVDLKVYDECISFLDTVVQQLTLDSFEKRSIEKRIAKLRPDELIT
ncbi:hypothetical protein Asulf_01651 [Archaeoglobus sulfaticallidus PM70-1]|uniref:DUF763 domain-containing protein n=1 Tax=Archaeoglobus sulfaticallidus PM70-1 TaxID=387631 RepID=N0BMX5_9EURY|nr:DUF763 domain-containing protein [Archaeoglobus sulfaticallidus]AGK61625.1 hypothetical protein Asulf_01651 [Archaeoglobus sulfaticallidus PM70-1]